MIGCQAMLDGGGAPMRSTYRLKRKSRSGDSILQVILRRRANHGHPARARAVFLAGAPLDYIG